MVNKKTILFFTIIIVIILLVGIYLSTDFSEKKEDKTKYEETPVYEAERGKWEILGPGGGGTLESILVGPTNDDIVYAIINCGGVRKSINGGKEWLILNNGLKYHEYGTLADNVAAIAIHPTKSNILILGLKNMIYKSIDSGLSWEEEYYFKGKKKEAGAVGSITFALSNPSTIYAAEGEIQFERGDVFAPESKEGTGTVYKSIDEGESWQIIDQNPNNRIDPKAQIFSIIVHPQNENIIYISSNKGVYKSIDSGILWMPKNNGLPHTETWKLAMDINNPEILYLTISTKFDKKTNEWQGGVYKTVDGGENWIEMNDGIKKDKDSEYLDIIIDQSDPSSIYIGNPIMSKSNLGGIYRSRNNGPWERITNDEEIIRGWSDRPISARAITAKNGIIFFSAKGGALYKSTNFGDSFEQVYTKKISQMSWQTTGLELIGPTGFAIDPKNQNVVYASYGDHGVWKSEDNGFSFKNVIDPYHLEFGQNPSGIFVDSKNPSTVYVTTGLLDKKWASENNGHVIRSDDYGETWRIIGGGPKKGNKNGLPSGLMLDFVIDVSDNNKLFVADYDHGIYMSDDKGENWKFISNGIENNKVVSLVQDQNAPNMFYAGTEEPGEIYKSVDYSISWDKVNEDQLGQSINELEIDQINDIVYAATDLGVYKSEDFGVKWVKLKESPGTIEIIVNPKNPDILYAGSHYNGVFKSTDGGKTWIDINDPNNSKDLWELYFDQVEGVLYAGFKCAALARLRE